jgi:hypothetical protein
VLLYTAPLAFAAALGPRRLLGYYSGVADLHVRPGAIVHWLGTDSMLLAYAAGFALVPGAVAGIAYALWRPRSREESGLAALSVGLLLGLFAEAALYATNGSDRFQERYLMILLPLVFPRSGCGCAGPAGPSGRPRRAGAAGALDRVLSPDTPSAAPGRTRRSAPLFRLEKAIGISDGSLRRWCGRRRARLASRRAPPSARALPAWPSPRRSSRPAPSRSGQSRSTTASSDRAHPCRPMHAGSTTRVSPA